MLKTAIIGCGRIAMRLEEDPLRYKPCTHAGAMLALNQRSSRPAFHIGAVCDTNPAHLHYARKYLPAVQHFHQDYRHLLRKNRFDLVVISTWTPTHLKIARAALQSGARALVIEKPICGSPLEARDFYRLARHYAVPIWINFERRYHPAYRNIKRMIHSGTLGELRSLRARVLGPAIPFHSGTTSPLLHDAVHFIDLLLWYMGQPSRVQARMLPALSGARVEDTAWIAFQYDRQVAWLESGGQRDFFEFSLELDFSHGRILASNSGHKYYQSTSSRYYQGFRDLQEIHLDIPTGNPWLLLYTEILQYLRCRRSSPGAAFHNTSSSLLDSVRGIALIDDCYRSAGSFLPPPRVP